MIFTLAKKSTALIASLLICFGFLQCKKDKMVLSKYKILSNIKYTQPGAVIPLADGNMIFRSLDDFDTNSFVLRKVSANAKEIWKRDYNFYGFYEDGSGVEDAAGNLYFIGSQKSQHMSSVDLRVLKFTANGELLWTKALSNTAGFMDAGRITTTRDGHVLCAFSNSVNASAGCTIHVYKMDGTGKIIWYYYFYGAAQDVVRSVKETPNSEVVILSSASVDGIVHITKLNNAGSALWTKYLDKPNYFHYYGATDMIMDENNIVICGYENSLDPSDQQCYLVKLDVDGRQIYENNYGHKSQRECAFAITKNNSGSYILTGYSQGDSTSGTGMLAMQIKNDGKLEYYRAFGPGFNNLGRIAVCDKHNICTIAGIVENFGKTSFSYDILIAQLDSEGYFH